MAFPPWSRVPRFRLHAETFAYQRVPNGRLAYGGPESPGAGRITNSHTVGLVGSPADEVHVVIAIAVAVDADRRADPRDWEPLEEELPAAGVTAEEIQAGRAGYRSATPHPAPPENRVIAVRHRCVRVVITAPPISRNQAIADSGSASALLHLS